MHREETSHGGWYYSPVNKTCTVKSDFKTTWEIGITWELRRATSVPRPIQYKEINLRNKPTSEFMTVFHSPLGVPNSQVPLYITTMEEAGVDYTTLHTEPLECRDNRALWHADFTGRFHGLTSRWTAALAGGHADCAQMHQWILYDFLVKGNLPMISLLHMMITSCTQMYRCGLLILCQ